MKITTKEMQLVEVGKLVPYARNARTHSAEQIDKIRSSLREFGFVNPLIIDREYNIIAGHGRLIAAEAEGYKKVPCVFAEDLTDEQKRAYIIADNRMALDAGWDEDLLRIELQGLQDVDFDLSLTGFEPSEIDSLLCFAFDPGEPKEDDFDVEEQLKKPVVSRLNDIWTLGRHKVVCGDSTKADAYASLLGKEKANLVVTDPPYNVNYEGNAGKIKNDHMKDGAFYEFLFDAFTQMESAMANDASIYVFHADTEGLNFRKAFKEAGFYLSGCCIWKKNALVLGRSPYQWIHEPCLYGWKQKGKHQWYSDRKQTTVWEYDKPRSSKDHPTMKPINLLCYPISNSTMTNGIVLDPFLGSGSTLIACCETERICRGIELDPRFVDVIVNRFIEWQGGADEVYLTRDGETMPFADVPGVEAWAAVSQD